MNRNDRKVAIAALTVAVAALVALALLDRGAMTTPDGPHAGKVGEVDSDSGSTSRQPAAALQNYQPSEPQPAHELFAFDPNSADSTALLRLGLRPWQVRAIYRYRAKGGIFRSKADFARLYGLTVREYRRLEPYIRISADYQPAATLFAKADQNRRDTLRYPVKLADSERVELNSADTTLLKRVPGIGSYYARKVAEYRRRLGGYVSTDQLDEISGFPPAAKRFFVISNPHPAPLRINELTVDELRRHPYLNYYQAKAIADYRRLHGPIKSLRELSLCRDFTPQAISRLEPYIAY